MNKYVSGHNLITFRFDIINRYISGQYLIIFCSGIINKHVSDEIFKKFLFYIIDKYISGQYLIMFCFDIINKCIYYSRSAGGPGVVVPVPEEGTARASGKHHEGVQTHPGLAAGEDYYDAFNSTSYNTCIKHNTK